MELSLTMEAPALGELVAAARRGDQDAFTFLVSPHLETALRVARVVAGSPDDGTDALAKFRSNRVAGLLMFACCYVVGTA